MSIAKCFVVVAYDYDPNASAHAVEVTGGTFEAHKS